MRIIDHRTGRTVHQVASQEEVLLALSAIVNERLARAVLANLLDGFDNGEEGALYRSTVDAVKETAVLGGVLLCKEPGDFEPYRWREDGLFFRPFNSANTTKWPVSVAELRTNNALADHSIDDLATHLNTQLRADAADVLTACANHRWLWDDNTEPTIWDQVRRRGDLGAATLDEVTNMVRSPHNTPTPLWDWTPTGGTNGDPFGVCAYEIGPLRYDIRLEADELLRLHLAGDTDLTLYRTIIDAGVGRTELTWPPQHFTCCDQTRTLADADRIPTRVDHTSRAEPHLVANATQCRLCGATRYASLLTRRALNNNSEPLGIVEHIDTLPTATLTAAAANGLWTICEPPRFP